MQLSDFGVTKQKFTLDSGVPLVVFERPGMPISLRVAFFSGSRFDPPGKEGLAHFAEHMVLSGNKKYTTKREISTFVESLGAGFNGSTSADKMDLVLDYADPDDSPAMVNLLDQFLTQSLFDPSTLENERGAILAELAGKLSDPGVYIHRLWKTVAYQGNLLNRDTIGSEESILSITKEDLLQYYQNQLTANRAVIIASGGVKASELAKLFNHHSIIRPDKSERSLPSLNKPQRTNPILVRNYPKSEQAHIAFGFITVPENHPDFWPVFVLSRILGGSRTSRIYHRLRFELGLVYSANARIDSWFGTGRIVANASCKTKNTQQVLNEITTIFQNSAQGSTTLEELEHCKAYITKAQKLRMQTSSAWASYHTSQIMLHPEQEHSIAQDLEHIKQVTLEQVNQAAQKYITSDGWYLAVCGDLTADSISVDL